ncbi:MAG: tRNA (N6-threonylcarbamoyladenosine(37)-N6)-methyltransferase TrmO [Clostridia bacterium]|nr:tRNA (N6-threonylcarbamoyladenosine(37)-N6)-methyltransferase TrmO [Clostridia bacterium]
MTERRLKIIGHIRTDFPEKFGLPRQSGLARGLIGRIELLAPYRNEDAIRGIEDFSHLWLLWDFSQVPEKEGFEPLVRPPRLGGNERMGVFATRSPFRPNPLGLSVVRLERVERTEDGPVLVVSGVDMMDGTPLYDIKPYLPYADAVPGAVGGFAEQHQYDRLKVHFPEEWLRMIPEDRREALMETLALDPRPAYHRDPDRVYGFGFQDKDVRFRVNGSELTVIEIKDYDRKEGT